MTARSSTTVSAPDVNTNHNTITNANKNVAPTPTSPANYMNTDCTKTVNVKKIPFDETGASFYHWATKIWGIAETYN
jgi:hypothetical protein